MYDSNTSVSTPGYLFQFPAKGRCYLIGEPIFEFFGSPLTPARHEDLAGGVLGS